MIRKLAEAAALLLTNLGSLGLVVLTIALPLNMLTEWIAADSATDEFGLGSNRLMLLLDGVFSPIYIAAVLYALSEQKQGREVGYLQTMRTGLEAWGRLFAARFISGLMIGLGTLAFIVPGIILALRYALVDSVAVLEGARPSEAMRRSTELTAGRRWEILGTGLLFFVAVLLLSAAGVAAMELLLPPEPTAWLAANVVLDCVLDYFSLIITVAFFLYYWDATEDAREPQEPAEPQQPTVAEIAEAEARVAKWQDDDNPYRTPLPQ